MKFRLPLLASAVVAGALLSSCASERVKAENKKAKEDKAEYVYVHQVGSQFPVKVRKDQVHAADGESEKAQEALREAQRKGSRAVSDKK